MNIITQREIESLIERATTQPYQPIRNYIDGKPVTAAEPIALDFGVHLYGAANTKSRELTAEECNKLFGVSQAVKMNFVPQMLNALLVEQAGMIDAYCVKHRISELKKHTRILRTSVKNYREGLMRSYGSKAYGFYLLYVQRYTEAVASDMWLMQMHADELCRNQLPGKKHRELASRVLVALMLIAFTRKYDAEMDRLIESKTGLPARQRPDLYIATINALCVDIGESYGYRLEPDKQMADWMKILSNRALRMADTIIAEEEQAGIL